VSDYTALRVEFAVRDQFVSRRDMWQLIQFLHKKTMYKNQLIEIEGLRFKVRNIFTSASSATAHNNIQTPKSSFGFSQQFQY